MSKIAYTLIGEKDAGKSTKEFEVEIDAAAFDAHRIATLKKITADAELPGFRKGKAPEAMVAKQVGEMSVLERAAEEAVNEAVFGVLAEKQLKFVGQPSISITTLAPGNPLRFKMTVAIVPSFELPDYKKIAADLNKKTPTEVLASDKELEESVEHIKKMLAGADKKEPAPELTDESVKKLGGFTSVAEFKERLKNDMSADKLRREREKTLLEIIEKIVKGAKMDIPDTLVEHELDRIEAEFEQDIERMGKKTDEYLASIKKTRDELRKEWRDNAEKRAKFELILPKIAAAEKLVVPAEDLERETKHLLEHYQGADKEAAKLYVERALMRQKVLEFLERQK